MEKRGNLPLGNQVFPEIRKLGMLYVDKTQYIARFVENNLKYVFLSRPHRFGKTLFVSTLQTYFEGDKAPFQGLYLEQAEEALAQQQQREPWQAYPILRFDFNGKNYTDETALTERITTRLAAIEQKYGITPYGSNNIDERFLSLIQRIYEKTHQQVVVIIDEYDKPLLETFENPELNQAYRAILKSFYEILKQCDQYLRFAFLTGITKFNKLALFSGLNNLKDITLLDGYNAICGFTEQELTDYLLSEITQLAEANNQTVDEARQKLKKNYDGYRFSQNGVNVYNPFSLVNVLSDCAYRFYWFETATPAFLITYLKQINYFVPNLQEGVAIDEGALQDFRIGAHNPLPILYQAGYLTIESYEPEDMLYHLRFPNEEVRYGFLKVLLCGYYPTSVVDAAVHTIAFRNEILRGDVDTFMKHLEGIIAGIPYGEFSDQQVSYRERDGQVAIFLVFKLLGHFVQTEVHNHIGRADAVVHTPHIIYIFEFKLDGTGTPEDALQQIEARSYAKPYQGDAKEVVCVGVAFSKTEKNISSWAVRRGV